MSMRIGVIGGTGREGFGLGVRWAKAGYTVSIGSRDAARARVRAEAISRHGWPVRGSSNAEACRDSEIVVLSVPYAAHDQTLRELETELRDKILIDITVPLAASRMREVTLPPGTAAALEAQRLLGSRTRVVAALHHVSSAHLGEPSRLIDCDVLVCGDDAEARRIVILLIEQLGVQALDAGPLQNAIALESLTPVLIHLNQVYGGPGPGVRFTGLPR
jgi:8-hydroxy-5-deazaflavin:NADPH oxidoreductase